MKNPFAQSCKLCAIIKILLTQNFFKGFYHITDKYHMIYIDNDLCGIMGDVKISFANAAKTQLNIDFDQRKNIIDADCYYYSYQPSQYPEPLPKNNIILIKQ